MTPTNSAEEPKILVLNCKDIFGDNGLVALALLQGANIVQVVMSCRVFGFGLETALLCEIFRSKYRLTDNGAITAQYVDTAKNKSAESYFKDNGFQEEPDCLGTWRSTKPPAWPDWIGVD